MTVLNGDFKNQKVIVTGGAGFIGSSLVRVLSELGADVHVIDNLVNGKAENLEGVDCQLHEIDIREAEKIEPLMKDTSVVFHLACLGVRHSLHDPFANHEVNASATLSLLHMARNNDVGRFIYTSTSEVYGTAKTVPMDEQHPTFPMTVYGASKLAGECYTRAFWETYGYATTVIRPFNAYGPRCHHEGDSGEVIPKFMLRTSVGKKMVIFGDGSQTRDFTFVEDTAKGIAAAALNDKSIGETINIGYGSEMKILNLAQEIAALYGKNSPDIEFHDQRPGDVLRLYANTNKAQDLLGFEPEVSFAEGLQQLKTWYEEQGQSAEKLLEEERVHNWLVEA